MVEKRVARVETLISLSRPVDMRSEHLRRLFDGEGDSNMFFEAAQSSGRMFDYANSISDYSTSASWP